MSFRPGGAAAAQNPADNVAAVWLSDLHAGQRNFERAYDLLLQLPNSGQLRDGPGLLPKEGGCSFLLRLSCDAMGSCI